MKRHFEARTKSEAQEMADAWWRTQSGQTAILWVTRAMNDDEPPTKWEVVVHYRKAAAPPRPPWAGQGAGKGDRAEDKTASNRPPTSERAAERSAPAEDNTWDVSASNRRSKSAGSQP